MFQQMFRSGDLPAGERLAAADELFGRSVLPMRLVSGADRAFEATVRHVDLAPLKVVELAATPAAVLRTLRLIRQGDPEMLSVIVPMNGVLVVSQCGRESVVGRDQLALYDSSRPFQIGMSADGGMTAMVSVHVPRSLLEPPLAGFDRLLARPLPGATGSGFGALLVQLLTDVAGGPGSYRPVDLARLGSIAQTLVTAMLAHHLDAEAALQEDAHHRSLLLRIDAFVHQHLHDPSLSPPTIAAAHHISVSHLHRLFVPRGTTVAAWIRRQRLERARRDLVDLHAMPVHRIATRWGFASHSAFTRAFRAAYGTAPLDYRCEVGEHPRPPGPPPPRGCDEGRGQGLR